MDSLQLKALVLIGLGNQGQVWAQNLKDSGFQVWALINDRPNTIDTAEKIGISVLSLDSKILKEQNLFALLTPDHTHKQILKEYEASIPMGASIILAHGFSFVYDDLAHEFPQWNFLLLAPKPIAREFRLHYLKGKLVPALIDVASLVQERNSESKDDYLDLLKKLAKFLGCIPFLGDTEMEAKSDLLSEQTLLCSLIPYGALLSYQKLRELGASSEMAYFECWYELSLIVNTMVTLGPREFFKKISPNALIGAKKGMDLLAQSDLNAVMEKLKVEICSGKFALQVKEGHISTTRNEMDAFWSKQELQTVHDKLKNLFY